MTLSETTFYFHLYKINEQEICMNIFERLRQDHGHQRELIEKLINTQGDEAERSTIFENLKQELLHHAKAEERFFYTHLLEDDITQKKTRHSIAEHHEMDKLIEELTEKDFSSPGWLVTAKTLYEKLEHHLAEEEHEIFQVAGKALNEQQKIDLATEFDKFRKNEN
jgi:hypothetical protein